MLLIAFVMKGYALLDGILYDVNLLNGNLAPYGSVVSSSPSSA